MSTLFTLLLSHLFDIFQPMCSGDKHVRLSKNGWRPTRHHKGATFPSFLCSPLYPPFSIHIAFLNPCGFHNHARLSTKKRFLIVSPIGRSSPDIDGWWLQGKTGSPANFRGGGYPKSLHSLNMKNGRSDTPLSWARKALIFELNDSAAALVECSRK